MPLRNRLTTSLVGALALTSALSGSIARAETPTDVESEARRFESVLEIGARSEASARRAGGWSLIGLGVGAMAVAPLMIGSDDQDVTDAGWWTLGLGGLSAGFGISMLAITGSLEDLREEWRNDPAPAGERLARFEATLAEMADSARDARVVTGVVTTVLSAGLLGWGFYEAGRDDSWDGGELSLVITGGFGLAAGLYSAIAGETQLESLQAAWSEGRPGSASTVSLSPTFGLGPNGGFLGLAGGF